MPNGKESIGGCTSGAIFGAKWKNREGADIDSEDGDDDEAVFSADEGEAPSPTGENSTSASFVDLWKSCWKRIVTMAGREKSSAAE